MLRACANTNISLPNVTNISLPNITKLMQIVTVTIPCKIAAKDRKRRGSGEREKFILQCAHLMPMAGTFNDLSQWVLVERTQTGRIGERSFHSSGQHRGKP